MKVTDPVCGRSLDLEKALAQEDYNGWAYFFCSRDCHRLFGLSPERFSEKHETAPVDKEPSETAQPRSIKCEGA
jgi:YHS domain-containing protein